MASTRLRKTFQYPADNSDDDETPRELDEEEQEKLIQNLRAENEERNEEYMRIFLAIPLISIMAYLPSLAIFPSLQAKFISVLSITSLASTAYILFFIPNEKPESAIRKGKRRQMEAQHRPIHQYLGYLNGGLSLLIGLNTVAIRGKKGVHDGFWILCLLPGVVLFVVFYARRVMLSVNVEELEGLKYNYKGA